MVAGVDWDDMHPSAFPGAGYGKRPCTKCGTIIPDNVGGILGAAGHVNGPGPFCSVACWSASPPPDQMVWLGDLAGWSIGLTTDAECPIILHRCGFAHMVPAHDNFLANVAQWVSQNRDGHSCDAVMRAFRQSR